MVKFLIQRPIAVVMAFLAIVITGCVTFMTLPVSLLPDVAIPHITVTVDGGDMSARELDNAIVGPLRRHLMQVEGLNEMKSETSDASARINLSMEYGVDTDLAFVEVNEKIDAAMNSFPHGTSRPKAVKGSATDIPVVYVNMTLRSDGDSFPELGDLAGNVVRRRLEQLPEVAMVDMTGVPGNELRILPDRGKMMSAGLTDADLESVINACNTEPGSMTVRDGYYEYNIHVSNQLHTPEDVKGVRLTKNGRIYTIGDFCDVELAEEPPAGYSLYNGKRAVTMAIIKHSAASMDNLEEAVSSTLDYFSQIYPGIEFSTSRSQTQLLDFTISNLEQNLILGLILVFLICALFMKSARLPFVIGLTIIVAVIMTFLMFYLFGVSINIVSLAGLILAVGMMIDNSVIVAENITQYRRRGLTLQESCIAGTNEMITPMLSSSLTTVAVFVPLVFMSGIAGAIFSDQAFAITAGLASSYIVGITLLPVLYSLFFSGKGNVASGNGSGEDTDSAMIKWYDRGIDFVFSHKVASIAFVAASVASVYPLFSMLETERMPRLDSTETILTADWNENITIEENRRRTEAITKAVTGAVEHSAYVGAVDFVLDNETGSMTTTELYYRTESPSALQSLKDSLSDYLAGKYPKCKYEFSAPDNVFEKVFSTDEPPLEARLTLKKGDTSYLVESVEKKVEAIADATGRRVSALPLREQINISVSREMTELYGVDYNTVLETLRTSFRGKEAGTLKSYREYVPVRISDRGESVATVLASSFVTTKPGDDGISRKVPLKALVSTSVGRDFKSVISSESGAYFPVTFNVSGDEAEEVESAVLSEVAKDNDFDVEFCGALFSNREMMSELTVILLVSLLLMYFILCAQFESFLQPLIVLTEIPVDVTFALLTLWLSGHTLNIMSAIGIIVTCGIVVNDSILKIDAINELRKTGMPLVEAIHTAGRRRLKPIIMTSLTTIAAMVPVLFTSDMGSELQQPLAVALIGSMTVGTLVSIFIIPLVYYLIYRKRNVTQAN